MSFNDLFKKESELRQAEEKTKKAAQNQPDSSKVSAGKSEQSQTVQD